MASVNFFLLLEKGRPGTLQSPTPGPEQGGVPFAASRSEPGRRSGRMMREETKADVCFSFLRPKMLFHQ